MDKQSRNPPAVIDVKVQSNLKLVEESGVTGWNRLMRGSIIKTCPVCKLTNLKEVKEKNTALVCQRSGSQLPVPLSQTQQ